MPLQEIVFFVTKNSVTKSPIFGSKMFLLPKKFGSKKCVAKSINYQIFGSK